MTINYNYLNHSVCNVGKETMLFDHLDDDDDMEDDDDFSENEELDYDLFD